MTTPPRPDTFDEIDVGERLAAGYQEFLGVQLLCGSGALVPRPETAVLAQAALRKVREAGPTPFVIDMCCGVGTLACAIAVHAPTARVWASDLTDECVSWTRRNVQQLRLEDRVSVHQGDLFAGLANEPIANAIDVIVCNPPYISTGRLTADRATLLEKEPRAAFDGGAYGLSIHQRVVKEALPFLKPGGWLLFEIGVGQERQVKMLFERARAYIGVDVACDSRGRVRAQYAQRATA